MSRVSNTLLGVALMMAAAQAMAESFEGQLRWLQRVELSTLVSGVVEQVAVAPGDRVAKGDLLVQLDQGALRAGFNQAEAELAFQQAALEEAERELERTQELYDRTLLSDHDLELARINAVRSKAAYQRAQAQLADARERLRYSAVRAPFDGVVLRRNVEPGQIVVTRLQSVPLVTMAGTGELLARMEAGAEQLAGIEAAEEIRVRVGDRQYRGEIYHIGVEPVAAGGDRYPVDVVFSPDSERTLRIGQPVVVDFP
ncbi:efflux RND transporter periplasmic adaptor subunit [Thiohalomonas denitrificans]|uniref:RND family efflux transporter, MFP subunit n=1 Tax=Thiohalomonas denitrificans TaxID=415747 RepID=A0A1G5QMT5_9GAMM|nr:efflux RND transporter periplasmic adaptor subunit [Thiohalomonas denitrificans]SCZ62870.1 RND family efflux transporter, MFP subunit [Thiohalomonas denitrificans]